MKYIGIDLGTTYSVASYLDDNGLPVTIPNAEGDLTTPSAVLFEDNGDVVVGREAKTAAMAVPENVALCAKRYMGDQYFPRSVQGQQRSPVAISAEILKKVRDDAELKIGPIEGAVITVPAYFDEIRRQATAEAGKQAGINVLDIINEPTSAALVHAYNQYVKQGGQANDRAATALALQQTRNIVVYDLGGGTFDVSVLGVTGRDIKVLATEGDVHLGGRDWDEKLSDDLADRFKAEFGTDPREDELSFNSLLQVAEDAKKNLSGRTQTHFAINHDGHVQRGLITREEFDRLTEPLLYRTERRLNRVISETKLSWDDIDEVLVVGGSTRMPQVHRMLKQITGQHPSAVLSPDEAVAHGAAIHAAIRLAQTTVPEEASIRDGFLAKLKGKIVDVLRAITTTNVNSHSLGVVVSVGEEKKISVIVPRNTQLPVSASKTYGTNVDNQQAVTIRVVEGEGVNPEHCMMIGTCRIEPLPVHLPKGSPIEVTFTYDNSGRLHVEAAEATSGKWASVSIKRRYGIGPAEVTPV